MSYSRINHLEKRGNDTIQENVDEGNSDSNVIVPTVQFYSVKYNSQSDRWIGLKFYHEFSDTFYINLIFEVNWSSKMYRNIGQQIQYKFCYLLPFDFWTSYLDMILFLIMQGYSTTNFGTFSTSTRVFNRQ
jgi:hypothetical protein